MYPASVEYLNRQQIIPKVRWWTLGATVDLGFTFWDNNIKCTNVRIIGVPEEEKKKGTEKIFEEIIVENFPNMGKEIVNQVQEAQRVPYRINPRRNMLRHILIKLMKIKHTKKY